MRHYFLRLFSLLSESLVFSPCFVFASVFILLVLLEDFTPVDFDCRTDRFVAAFCPGFETDLLVTVVVDLRVVPVFCTDEGLVIDFLVTVVFDLLVVPVFCPDGGFVTDLLVTVVLDLREVLVRLPVDCALLVD